MYDPVDEERLAVPGFGFLSPSVAAKSDQLFQVRMTLFAQLSEVWISRGKEYAFKTLSINILKAGVLNNFNLIYQVQC